jgi:hypothetical protein
LTLPLGLLGAQVQPTLKLLSMNLPPESRRSRSSEIVPFVILALAWFPMAVAEFDKHRNGPSEDMGFGMLLATVWLGGFWLLGIVFCISALNRASKTARSPAVPFFALLLYAGSAFSLFLWWLFFD